MRSSAIAGPINPSVMTTVSKSTLNIRQELLLSWSAGALFKNLLRNRHRGEHVGPSRVEGEMRDGLGDLGLRQAIVHPDRDMAGQLRHLTVGDQGADCDQASVARGEVGP